MKALAAFAAVLVLAACASAPQMPADMAAKVKAIGPVIDPPKTAVIYAPLQENEPYKGVRVLRDIEYGPDPRHLVDVFIPEKVAAPAPVLMFVHGGGFIRGSKRTPGCRRASLPFRGRCACGRTNAKSPTRSPTRPSSA